MRKPTKIHYRELISPLALASYAAWLAVYATNSGWLGLVDLDRGAPAQVLMWGFLVAWLFLLSIDLQRDTTLADLGIGVLAVCALGLLVLGQSGSGPILLVLLATQLASRFHGRGLVVALATINTVFLLIIWRVWAYPLNWTLVTISSYVAFQAFAALTMHYAVRSEKMADELREVNAHLLATRSLLSETARDQERLRLSRELHDVAGHKLTALKLNLRNLARLPELKGSSELQIATSMAGELLEELRAVVRQLRDHDGIDLAGGIRKLIEPLPRPVVELDIDEHARIPRAEQAETLLRVAQEGLTNAARHGRANRAWLAFKRDRQGFCLSIEDDGELTWPIKPGNGLTGMRERLEDLGGTLDLARSERGGMRLTATLPTGDVS